MKSLQAIPGGRQMTFTNPCMSSEGVDSALITCLLSSSISARSRQIPIPQWKKTYLQRGPYMIRILNFGFHYLASRFIHSEYYRYLLKTKILVCIRGFILYRWGLFKLYSVPKVSIFFSFLTGELYLFVISNPLINILQDIKLLMWSLFL